MAMCGPTSRLAPSAPRTAAGSTALSDHGAPVDNHHTFVRALLDHRLAREAAILQQLADGPKSAKEIVTVLYADVRKELHKPAARSVLSHLRKLHDEDVVELAIPGASTLSSKTVWVRR